MLTLCLPMALAPGSILIGPGSDELWKTKGWGLSSCQGSRKGQEYAEKREMGLQARERPGGETVPGPFRGQQTAKVVVVNNVIS